MGSAVFLGGNHHRRRSATAFAAHSDLLNVRKGHLCEQKGYALDDKVFSFYERYIALTKVEVRNIAAIGNL